MDDLYELSLADVGALTYRKSECVLNDVLEESLAMFQERCNAAQLHIELKLPAQPLVLEADAKRLQQLFSNLQPARQHRLDPRGRILDTLQGLR